MISRNCFVGIKNNTMFWLCCVCLFLLQCMHIRCQDYYQQGTNTNLGEAMQFLREYDREASGRCYRVTSAQWKFVTNITESNRRKMLEELELGAKFERISWKKAATFDWRRLQDMSARRQLVKIILSSRAVLPDDKYFEIQQLISEMKDTYNNARICPYSHNPLDPSVFTNTLSTQRSPDSYKIKIQSRQDTFQTNGHSAQQFDPSGYDVMNQYPNYQVSQPDEITQNYCDMQLDPEITRILAHSRIETELLYVWRSFRENTGPRLKNKFMRYVQLANQAARLNGFSDAGEQMRSLYEENNFQEDLLEVYSQIQPLYKQLFTYVRRKLVNKYGEGAVRPDGPIPAHLLGNMWAQNWKSLTDFVLPFPQAPTLDVTTELLRQGYTPLKMFQLAEEYYTSMGLKSLPPEFWRMSMLSRPSDRSVQCTASAWDFCNRNDYRIKQCTEITTQDLISTHHEMAHIQYYLQYAEQTHLFRDGANPAFHEGIANGMTLSVFNIPHLQRIGLYNNRTSDNYEVTMNFLLTMALEKVTYLPFAYLVDQWRWQVFQDGVRNMNARWWELKLRYQGVIPPIPRSEADFDPGSKYHIISDQEYIKYFLATVLEFQVFDNLCQAAGHTGPLHECDLHRNREAGRLLSEVLQLGASKPASEIIRKLTRGKTSRISPESLVKYFKPLEMWLRVQNRDEPVIGWNSNYNDMALFSPFRNKGIRIGERNNSMLLLTLSLLMVIRRVM